MEEYIELIKRTSNILDTAETIEDKTQRQDFLKENLFIFKEFKNSLHLVLREYQFKDGNDSNQNEIVDLVKGNIVRLIRFKDIFEIGTEYEYFESDLIDALSWNENKYAFNLQFESDIGKIQSALEYLQDREEYVQALKENNLFEGQDITEASAKKYVSNEFEQNMYGHILMQIKNNFLNIPKEQIVEIIKHIDNSLFFKDLISKDSKKMNFYEKNLMYQYSETILKMKSIFTPDLLKDDIVIQQMWDGKIDDNKTLKNILANISVKSFMDISGYDDTKTENGFITELSEHFKGVNLSEKNFALIMKNIFDSQSISYEVARFLAQIDIPNDYNEFLDSEYAQEFEWLTDFNTFDSLKKSEKIIEEAQRPFLPPEYYIKKLNKLQGIENINSHFVENLITLLHSDYYSQEEKNQLIIALKRNGLYSEYISEETIVFEEKDSQEETQLKVKQAYYSGQIIPLDIAQKLLNEDLAHKTQVDKEVLQGCVQSVICNMLKNNNINIQNNVFFGEGNGTLGYNDPNNLSIWIDDSLLEKYLDSELLSEKAELFKTMFHEMQHAIQYDNIRNGKIDYLTYNFIKEEVIEEYDKDFYNANYKSIFMESDARKGEILGALEFLNGLNPDFVRTISENMENEYIAESEEHTIYADAKKKLSIGKDTFIDISEYVGLLIQNNPKILEENAILGIEYNQDGTKKDIHTLLQEFAEHKQEENSNYKNMYSIYYGLITRYMETNAIEDSELQQQINDFMQEEQELVTMEDMQNCYHSVDKSNMQQLYARLYDITRNRQNKSISQEVGIDDKYSR